MIFKQGPLILAQFFSDVWSIVFAQLEQRGMLNYIRRRWLSLSGVHRQNTPQINVIIPVDASVTLPQTIMWIFLMKHSFFELNIFVMRSYDSHIKRKRKNKLNYNLFYITFCRFAPKQTYRRHIFIALFVTKIHRAFCLFYFVDVVFAYYCTVGYLGCQPVL